MWIRFLSILCAATLALAVPGSPANAGDIRVAVAANFRAPLEPLALAFEKASGHKLLISAGSTGQLFAQIANGAPFDVFLAADSDRPARLASDGFGVTGSVFTYASGRLALIARAVPAVGETPDLSGFRRIAIANPRTAPYGAAAAAVLEDLGAADVPRVEAGNVGAVGALVVSGAAEAGITAASLAPALARHGLSAWPVPPGMHPPLRQDAILLTAGQDNAAAIAFLDWLRQDEARAIIRSAGYRVD